MSNDSLRAALFDPARLRGMRRGIEKESLRVTPQGALATTPHPAALGSALTHPHITTDYSEAQLELITGVHAGVDDCLRELTEVHQFVFRQLGDERMWVGSMPGELPAREDDIPLGRYGHSNVGTAKTVYRMGLAWRYGRRMQTISGIHYNWSLPGLSDADHFALIRNFRRHAFVLLYLFGASPAVCSSFVAGRDHGLQSLSADTHYLPHATSLRMGRLGYQSDAQASLAVSYNDLDGYAASLHDALTRPYPPYEAMGVRGPDGAYRQLSTTLLQIENEFYGSIRPKRTIHPGERPLHALRERGVEYIEVRLMDLDPFLPVGIEASTMRFLDVFLLHCLQRESPPDTPAEIAALGRNQHLTAAFGRQPGLRLEREGRDVPLADWAAEVLAECVPIAQRLDAVFETDAHSTAVAQAQTRLRSPEQLPSSRVLAAMRAHGDSHARFTLAQSAHTRDQLLGLPYADALDARMHDAARQSLAEQARIEASDSLPFERYRHAYIAPERLSLGRKAVSAALAAP